MVGLTDTEEVIFGTLLKADISDMGFGTIVVELEDRELELIWSKKTVGEIPAIGTKVYVTVEMAKIPRALKLSLNESDSVAQSSWDKTVKRREIDQAMHEAHIESPDLSDNMFLNVLNNVLFHEIVTRNLTRASKTLSTRAQQELEITIPSGPGVQDAVNRSRLSVLVSKKMIQLLPFWMILEEHFNSDPVYLVEREIKDAIQYARYQLQTNKANQKSWLLLASCHAWKKDYKQAEKMILEQIRDFGENQISLFALGALEMGKDRIDQAVEHLETADKIADEQNFDEMRKVIHDACFLSKLMKKARGSPFLEPFF